MPTPNPLTDGVEYLSVDKSEMARLARDRLSIVETEHYMYTLDIETGSKDRDDAYEEKLLERIRNLRRIVDEGTAPQQPGADPTALSVTNADFPAYSPRPGGVAPPSDTETP